MPIPMSINGANHHSTSVTGFGPSEESEKLTYHGINDKISCGRFIITAEVPLSLVET